MEISRPATLTEFAGRAASFLSRHESEHGLMLGVAAATTDLEPHAYFGLVMDRGGVVGAGLRTNSRLILSREGAVGAMAALAADAVGPHMRDVLGPRAAVESFVLAVGGQWKVLMEQGIYECRSVTASPTAPGVRRIALPDDRERVAEFVQGLSFEALDEWISMEEALVRADAHIANGAMHVWEHGDEIVSLAAAVAPTPKGIRINHVYTPPALRGHGYAGALVASLTQAMLDAGRQFVFLHTDLSNPVSNRLYVRLGYRQIGDLDVLRRG
jgi:predicted GNAT family acetyltransferase